jgi:hypothetical protein
MITLPPDIEALADELAEMHGAVAVALGGSRALGVDDPASDWDLCVYYRGALDTTAIARRGAVHPPGAWGRIMNGGAWLRVGGAKVDVLLRDLSVVERWCDRAAEGVYEIDALLGYLAGVPTYSLLAERAVGCVLRGALEPVAGFPARLCETAPARWRFDRRFSLEQARMRAERGDLVGTVGQTAKAVIEQAHALLCERSTWVLNEKRIVERAGLARLHGLFEDVPRVAASSPDAELLRWVARADALLGD